MKSVLLFDGDCGFCSRCAASAQRWVRSPAPIVPWQRADLGKLGLTPQQCERAVQWVDTGTGGLPAGEWGPASEGPAAIASLLQSSPSASWRFAGRALALRPILAAAWPVYRWVARHRDRMPGSTASCALPLADSPVLEARSRRA